MIKVTILTISDSCSKGQREDVSGQTIREILASDKFDICDYKIVADEHESIKKELIYFKNFIEIIVIRNKLNLFFAGGNNKAIKIANGDYICLLNNDTEVEPNFIENMVHSVPHDSMTYFVDALTGQGVL